MTPLMTNPASSSSSVSVWRYLSLALSILVLVQWLVVTYWLMEQHRNDTQDLEKPGPSPLLSRRIDDTAPGAVSPISSLNYYNNNNDHTGATSLPLLDEYDGVAVTLMLRAPKWFHRRYTVMLHNVLANLPSEPYAYPPNQPSQSTASIATGGDSSRGKQQKGWALQIIGNLPWLEKEVFPLHPALKRMLTSSSSSSFSSSSNNQFITNHSSFPSTTFQTRYGGHDIFLSELPNFMTRLKPKQILKQKWFWESIVAENVFMFSGNGALCANHETSHPLSSSSSSSSSSLAFLNQLAFKDQWDYVGVPWKKMDQMGGDGSTHSFRRKSAMLRILSTYPPPQDPKQDNDPDFHYFVKHMLLSSPSSSSVREEQQPQQQHEGSQSNSNYPYKVANPETTHQFGGVRTIMDTEKGSLTIDGAPPFVISGTMAGLEWSARESLLQVCPEVKMIFPSLHEPSCFGAHPDGAKCKATICALRDKIPGSGC